MQRPDIFCKVFLEHIYLLLYVCALGNQMRSCCVAQNGLELTVVILVAILSPVPQLSVL